MFIPRHPCYNLHLADRSLGYFWALQPMLGMSLPDRFVSNFTISKTFCLNALSDLQLLAVREQKLFSIQAIPNLCSLENILVTDPMQGPQVSCVAL
jgi:hypothetical protein